MFPLNKRVSTRQRVSDNWELKNFRSRIGKKVMFPKIQRNVVNSHVPRVKCLKTGAISLYLGQTVQNHQVLIQTNESDSWES